MRDVVELHQEEYGEKPVVTATGRGVINVMGSYTEATRGLLLMLGTGYEATVAVSGRTDGSMRIFAADLDERQRTSSSALRFRPDQRFAGIAKGVLQRLRLLGIEISGLNATISSRVPSGCGFGASQAIAVAFARATARLFGRKLKDWEAAEIAHYAEHTFLQIHVGLASFLGAALAEQGSVTLLDMRELRAENISVPSFADLVIAITTNAPAALTASDEWDRDQRCELCLQMLTGKGSGCSFQEITLQELAEALGEVPEESRRWCRHIVEENQRVHDLICSIEEGDLKRLGSTLTESHTSMSDLYEASFPEVDWLVKHVDKVEGVYGARLVGGRKSTSVLVCGALGTTEHLEELLREYEQIFGFSASVVPLCDPHLVDA